MRLLLFSDSPGFPVSYANVVRHFAHAISERGVEVAFASVQHTGSMMLFEHRGRTYRHYAGNPPYRTTEAVRDFDPDLMLHVRDPIVHIPRMYPTGNYSVKAIMVNGSPVWGWIPCQHEDPPWDYIDALLREYSVVLPFTAAGAETFANVGMVRDRLDPLPLGVSDSYSDPEGPVATGYGHEGVPVVMSVGMGHQDRKAFPVIMRAYREARAVRPELTIDWYLHTLRVAAFDLEEHARMMGVDGHFLFPHLFDPLVAYPEEDLARRYRKAVAYVSVGTGEGFDMPLSEAASLGRVLIYPDEPNRREVVADYEGPKLSVRTFPIPRAANWERLIDPSDLAQQVLKLRDLSPDPAAGRKYFAAHSWDRTAERFLDICKRRGIA